MNCFNQQIENLQPSKSMSFMMKAKELQASDASIINLSGGEPDFDTPEKIIKEAQKFMNQGYTHYTIGPGLPELRDKIAEKLKYENHCHYTADEIIVTPGGKFAIYIVIRSLINPGDEVMYLEPGWVSYPAIIESSAAVPVAVRLSISEEYKITLEKLEAAYTEKTKVLIINYPNNPTGKVLTAEEAESITIFMMNHPDVFLLSDEMYERIIFNGVENISMASNKAISKRVITVNGFSKSVAMTGWRIGYLAADKALCKVIYKLYQHTVSCVSGFIQKAAIVALDCQEEIETMRKEYEKRRDIFVKALNEIPGIVCPMPEGAFYAWVNFSKGDMDAESMCNYILEEAKVVGVPGGAYGTDECCVRFSFASNENELKEAVKRIGNAMAKL